MIIKLIIIFFVFSLGQVTKATELWVKNETASSRFFLSPKKNNNGIQLNQFHQNKGEYQTLVKNFRFHTKADLDAFVFKYYPDYRAQAKLDFWPIKNNESEIVNKAFFGRSRNQSIWEAKNRWNNDWELKFGQWLKQEVTLDFYKKYNIPTDCADAVIGLRWIFSRINYLPVANTLSDTGNLFGQFSMKKEWKRLPTATNWY